MFVRDFMHANGSGKSNLDNGGNIWTYQGRDGVDNLAALRAADFFLPFAEALQVGDIINLVAMSATSALGISQVTTKTSETVLITTMAVTA
jgi:hypothetical protein